MEELIDEVDESGKVIATHPKSHIKEHMFLHKAVLVIPFTKDGKYLLGKRAKDKHPFPDSWCCAVGGKVSSGETLEEAAAREMKEELGSARPLRKVTSFLYNRPDYRAIFTIFTTAAPVSPDEFKPDPREVQYLSSFTMDEILEQAREAPDKFSPTFVAAIKEFAKHVKRSGLR